MSATRHRFALHYFHIISHPRNLLPRWRRSSSPGHMAGAAVLSRTDRETYTRAHRDSQWDGCYFHATFGFPAGVTGISLFIFRLLNYIPINNVPPVLPTSLFTIPPASRQDPPVLREAVKSLHLSSDSGTAARRIVRRSWSSRIFIRWLICGARMLGIGRAISSRKCYVREFSFAKRSL